MKDASQLALPGLAEETTSEWIWAEDTDDMDVSPFDHTTVMRAEVTEAVAPRAGGLYVDVTLGGGGHSEAILEAAPDVRLVAFDRDPVALRAAEARLGRFGARVSYVHARFSRIADELAARGIARVDGIVADLGVSSPQLDEAERGMSFRREGPIDMRMNPSDGPTALELIHAWTDDELANVIYDFGDERRSRRIARSIKRAAGEGQLETTLDLRRAIVRAVGPVRVGGVDPATRTFQALRIAVNDELGELDALLAAVPDLLADGAVAALLSFHSMEDRRVKQAFQARELAPLTKRPTMASDDETAANPRARSAKLRAARRREREP